MIDPAQVVELPVPSDALGHGMHPNSTRENTLPSAQVRLYSQASTAATSESVNLLLYMTMVRIA
jgi:hypothetical protein